MCGMGAAMVLVTGVGRTFIGEDAVWVTRAPALFGLISFALLANYFTRVRGRPHRYLFFALLPLLAHAMDMLLHANLAAAQALVNVLVLAVVCAAIESRTWARTTAIVWSAAYIICAWSASDPAVSPISFTVLTLGVSAFLYLIAAGYYTARNALQRKTIELEETQSLAEVGSWEVDLRTLSATWSPSTYQLLDWPVDKPIPSGFKELTANPGAQDQLARTIAAFFAGADSFDEIGQLVTASGRPIWVHTRGQTLYDDNGRATRKLGVFTDITQHIEREQALTQAKEVAEAAVIARTQFLANVSHEIRTPMNGVIGLTSLLAEGDLGPQERQHVEVIKNSGEALLTIINDILDFAKLDAGKLRLEHTAFDLAEVVNGSADTVRQTAEAKQLQLVVACPALSHWVMGDPGRLRQVLVNLLSNAVKFTHKGLVRLSVEAEVVDAAARLHFCIQDTGIGIRPADQATLFDPFTQADASTTRKYGGTGLGLSICQELVQQMGGQITVSSEVGQGSEFEFTLTLPHGERQDERRGRLQADNRSSSSVEANPAPAAAHSPTPVEQNTPNHPLRVLLVEDNLVNQRVASALLEKLGVCPQVASNGVQAVQQVQDNTFDLVLMDVQMPEMDGLEATRRIRAMDRVHQPKIIALTANALAQDRDHCLAAGMDDFLAKPVRLADLNALLARNDAGQPHAQSPGGVS